MRIGSIGEWKTWVREGWLFWVAFLLVCLGLFLLCLFPTKDAFRRVGFVYEIVGLLAVLVEIYGASSKHQVTPPYRRFKAYFLRSPLAPQNTKISAANPLAASGKSSVRARASLALPQEATLDQRVKHLEQLFEALDGRVEAVDERLERERRERIAAIASERAARETAASNFDEKIKDVEVGGLDLSLFGVVFLSFGLILTTAADEVLCLINWLL